MTKTSFYQSVESFRCISIPSCVFVSRQPAGVCVHQSTGEQSSILSLQLSQPLVINVAWVPQSVNMWVSERKRERKKNIVGTVLHRKWLIGRTVLTGPDGQIVWVRHVDIFKIGRGCGLQTGNEGTMTGYEHRTMTGFKFLMSFIFVVSIIFAFMSLFW